MDEKIWLGFSLLAVILVWRLANRRVAAVKRTLRRQIAKEQTRLEPVLHSAEAECLAQRQSASAAREFAECLQLNVTNPVLVADANGLLVSANTAAQALLGAGAVHTGEPITDWAVRYSLQYPSGQPVPPGAVPMIQTIRDLQATARAEFLLTVDQATRVIEMTAVPLLSTEKTRCLGAVVILNDVTDLRHSRQEAGVVGAHLAALARISGQLAAASTDAQVTQTTTEGALALLSETGVGVRAALFGLEDKRLIFLSEAPQRRPRRPRTQQQAQPPSWPFNAQLPLLWQLYVSRQSVFSADVTNDGRFNDLEARPLLTLTEDPAVRSLLAVPLVSGKHVSGHLVVTSPQPGVFSDKSFQDALKCLTGMAVLARAKVTLSGQSRQNAVEMEALWKVTQAITSQKDGRDFAKAFAAQVQAALGADICLLSLWETNAGGERRLRHQEWRPEDALLPGPTLTHLPAGCVGCDLLSEQAMRGNSVTRTGISNPSFGDCRWRTYAGQSGVHSVLAAFLRQGGEVIGALTVYRTGETPFTPTQIHLLETFAMLFASGDTPGS